MHHSIIPYPAKHGAFKFFLNFGNSDRILILGKSAASIFTALSKSILSAICVCSTEQEASVIKSICKENSIRNCFVVVADQIWLPFKNKSFNYICDFHNSSSLKRNDFYKELIRTTTTDGTFIFRFETTGNMLLKPLKNKSNVIEFTRLCKLHGMYTRGVIYPYPNFEKAHFLRLCNPNINMNSDGFVPCKKLSLINQSKCFITTKKDAKSKNSSLLQRLKDRLESEIGVKLETPPIIRVGTADTNTADFGKLILRLPQTQLGVDRCIKNYDMLQWLLKFPLTVTVPKPISKGQIDGQLYFAESKLPGLSLDIHRISKKSQNNIYAEALNLLYDERMITAKASASDFHQIVRFHVRELFPFINTEDHCYFEEFEHWTEFELNNYTMPLVVQHGDFKNSNFLCSEGFRKNLTGLIDWDLSDPYGLPLIDLVSLLACQANTSPSSYLVSAWSLVSGKPNAKIINYLDRMHIDIFLLQPLCLFAMIRHINQFIYYPHIKRNPAWYLANIAGLLIPAISNLISRRSNPHVF